MPNNADQLIRPMLLHISAVMVALSLSCSGPDSESTAPAATVELKQNEQGAWRFFIEGEEFPLRGAGGAEAPGLLEQLQAAGGNVTRTWGIETLAHTYENGETYLDRAHRLGLKVIPGLWVQHERHGFDYGNPSVIQEQRERILADVRRYKHHPAIIAWGVGNEMEGPAHPTGSIPVYREVEELAKLVKAEDTTRPVMTIIAFNPSKLPHVMEHCPSVDILGLNSYGGASGAGPALKAVGWTKPFAITEFGVPGFWEVPATPWGAPLEPDSQAKARAYYATHRQVFEMNDGHEMCLGSFAFLWGWKQEKTATWFGMFLPTLEKLPQVDAMTKAWTDTWPTNRCPKIEKFESSASAQVVKSNQRFTATATVSDPEGDTLRYHWEVIAESTARSEGGDAEYVPESFPRLVTRNHAAECFFTSPAKDGNYRLFLTVYDGKGSAATANFPFRVEK
jgi:hypothetical protein